MEAVLSDILSGEVRGAPRTKASPFPNPFVAQTAANEDLSYLAGDDSLLVYAVEHYERRRRLREGVVFDFLARRERTRIAWDSLVAAASARFEPESWMLPVSALKTPGVITGIHDYFPISETSPEIYDRERRARMLANGQRPWVILATLNGARHTGESFLHWVETELIPEISRSAREMALNHFRRETGPGGNPPEGPRRRIRSRFKADQGGSRDYSEKRLRTLLRSLACHQIRLCAAPGETMTRSLDRYISALPAGVDDDINLPAFIKRVDSVAESARAEWIAKLGEARLSAALANGSIRLV